MFSDGSYSVTALVIALFVKIEVFGAFLLIAPFIFTSGFGKFNAFTLTLKEEKLSMTRFYSFRRA